MAALTVLLHNDLLPLIQLFQHGLYEDLLEGYAWWRNLRTEYDSTRQQRMCLIHERRIALDEFFVDTPTDRSMLLHASIVDGSLPHVRRWLQYDATLLSKYSMDCAAAHGHLNVLTYLHTASPKGCTTDAMDFAALRGHLTIVAFLHNHRKEGCTKLAMDFAAGQGHLEVVRFLQEHRGEGCTQQAMDAAARNGHLAVLQYLHRHRREGFSPKAIPTAMARGHDAVVSFLLEV
ncbi:hypothetical protein ACHHYP_07899 [Achlya hypogyna]|uniref:Uncharacterized protein n=1 Tax=Achlya hypogyna TaxID=1202772 RepID=A0A1V9YQ84_ACHHY|nr:hypothetical protein ACHHYP_07899 [Achlya hypogyna]